MTSVYFLISQRFERERGCKNRRTRVHWWSHSYPHSQSKLRQASAVDAECPAVHFQSNLDVRLKWIRGFPSGGFYFECQPSRARKLNGEIVANRWQDIFCRICQPTTSFTHRPPVAFSSNDPSASSSASA